MAPEISVVIPTHNRPQQLRACLESLASQTLSPRDFEVVVVIDGPGDGTEEMLAELSTPYPLRVLRQSASGRNAALNYGAKEAKSPSLVLLDDDVVASRQLVAAHLDAQRPGDGIVGVGVVEWLPSRPSRFARRRAQVRQAHDSLLKERSPTLRDAHSCNLSLSSAMFDRVGGLADDISIERDTEFAFRLHEAGAAFRGIPDAVATVESRYDWRRVAGVEVQRGQESIELYRRHPALLPWLPLGRDQRGRGVLVLQRLLLRLRLPPTVVARLATLAPGKRFSTKALDLASTYAYWAGVRMAADRDTWRRLERGVLILMYHGVGEPAERPSRYVVPARRFERQMRWLKWRRYSVISLAEYLRFRAEFSLPPPKSVVITFDDGYLDNLTLARPILEQLGTPATIFLVSAGGQRNAWSATDGVAGRPLMSPDDARRALGGVVTFGAHTRTHPKLPDLRIADAEREILGSKEDLEATLGVPMAAFAYPHGRTSPELRAIVAGAFSGACGVEPGRNRPSTDGFALRRAEIYGTDSFPRFALTVWLGDLRRKT